ncbi:hypothetical protein ACFC1T_27805 [Kitasatospora sp. NPDC056076]|uniref:hypothetical protein n=1 Tax=Kitasatospora sp. NPDC056076 TaxID=3345703 RepID=UPI0035E21EC6
MDTASLDAAARRYQEAEVALATARLALQAEAVAALRAGTKQVDVVRATGWTREYLRKLRSAADKRDAEAAEN